MTSIKRLKESGLLNDDEIEVIRDHHKLLNFKPDFLKNQSFDSTIDYTILEKDSIVKNKCKECNGDLVVINIDSYLCCFKCTSCGKTREDSIY